MTAEQRTGWLRRALVLVLCASIVVGSAAAIAVAAAWRAAAAPLASRPTSAEAVSDSLAAQIDRADLLAGELLAARGRIVELDRALAAAGDRVATDAAQAGLLQERSATARAALLGVQAELRSARARLDALAAAAARAGAAEAPAAGRQAAEDEDEGEDESHESHESHDG